MKKRTGRKGCLKRMMMALSAFMLALSIPITALADGEFVGDITITGTVEGYEYKVYEVLTNRWMLIRGIIMKQES